MRSVFVTLTNYWWRAGPFFLFICVQPDSPGSATGGKFSGGCYVGTLKKATGSVEVLMDAERPKVWVNASSGLPELLFFASGGAKQPVAKDGRARGFTVVQRIRTQKPAKALPVEQRRQQQQAYRLVECASAPSSDAAPSHGCATVAP